MSSTCTGENDLVFRRLDTTEAIISTLQYQLAKQSQSQQEKSELQSQLSKCSSALNSSVLENMELSRKNLELESEGASFIVDKAHLISRILALEADKQKLTSEMKLWKKRCFDAIYKAAKQRPTAAAVTPGTAPAVRHEQSQRHGTTSLKDQASEKAILKTSKTLTTKTCNTRTDVSDWESVTPSNKPHVDSSGGPRPRPFLPRPVVPFTHMMQDNIITNASGHDLNEPVHGILGGNVSANRDASTAIGQQEARRASAASLPPSFSGTKTTEKLAAPSTVGHTQQRSGTPRYQNSEGNRMDQPSWQNPLVARPNQSITLLKKIPHKGGKQTAKHVRRVDPSPSNRGTAFYFCLCCKWRKGFALELQPPLDTNGNVSDRSTWSTKTLANHISSVRGHMKNQHPEVAAVNWPPGFAYSRASKKVLLQAT